MINRHVSLKIPRRVEKKIKKQYIQMIHNSLQITTEK